MSRQQASSTFLPLDHGPHDDDDDDVEFPLVDPDHDHDNDHEDDDSSNNHHHNNHHDHDPTHNHDHGHHHNEEEAALEALRAAISGSTHDEGSQQQQQPHQHQQQHDGDNSVSEPTLHSDVGVGVDVGVESDLANPTLVPASQVQAQSIDRAVAALQQLSSANQTIIDSMNAASILQGLMGSFKLLADTNRRQAELVKNLVETINGRGPPTIDPALAMAYVPRSEYDALRARYDALIGNSASLVGVGGSAGGGAGSGDLKTGGGTRTRSVRQTTILNDIGDDGQGGARLRDGGSTTPFQLDDEKRLGRKRRSVKLEHLVHKMANRRLGVEYPVSSFECKGSRDLPDPTSLPPSSSESLNGVDEFRPDFRADVSAPTVRPFVDTVIEDCKAAWNESFASEEPEVDDEQIARAVHTYWTRLSKRYDEQLTRERGEVHKDELTRRKQNQYRRQQSLVARRKAAFDTSPLNLCRLRALYRTLLTIDFAAMTNERADPKRDYTDDEWNAYRKLACGTRAAEAHEVVDQFWLSSGARSLLNILDTYAFDQSSKLRRKGRPKQPAPTFHLPPDLWDRSSLPLLRPKDAQGLPLAGAGGIILFKFHVDDKVQLDYPDWALGLYDNPPLPDEDRLLPNLPDVMNANAFYHLKPRIKAAREEATVTRLAPHQVDEIMRGGEIDMADVNGHGHGTGPDANAGATPHILDEAGVAAGVAASVAAAADAAAAAAAAAAADTFDLSSADFMSARGLESIVALASGHLLNNPFASTSSHPPLGHHHHHHPLMSLGLGDVVTSSNSVTPGGGAGGGAITITGGIHGPSPGSSVRARKQAKRMMSEVPGGAATPVPKRRRREGEVEADVDLTGDTSFLDSL